MTTETGFALKDKYIVQTEYYALRKDDTESPARFKQHYDGALKQFKAIASVDEVPMEADQAIDFIKWLDKTRYGQLQTDLDNNAA